MKFHSETALLQAKKIKAKMPGQYKSKSLLATQSASSCSSEILIDLNYLN